MSAPRRSGWRPRIALAGVSLAVPLVLAAALEGGLRLVGVGAVEPGRSSRLEYQHVELPVLRPAQRPDGARVLRTADPRLPYQSVLLEKPSEGLRVYVFGGSAAAGLGFSPNVTFARYLEEMLRAALPERLVEVVNLGIVALSSKQVRVLVEDVCRYGHPDLLIVYSGNNEFLEIHAEKYAAVHGGPGARLRRWTSDTNLYRALVRLRGRRPPASVSEAAEEELRLSEATLIADIEMGADDVAGVLDGYEANLDALAAHARERGVPLLLMGVAVNWRWRGREDLPESWVAELLGVERAVTDELRREALALLDARLAAGHGERHEDLFRRALLHEALGEERAARRDYRAAMNADPHLRRALDGMNDRVRAVARRRGAEYLDTVSYLAGRASDGIVGFDDFYDYVHFRPQGALSVAAELFRHMRAMELVSAPGFDVEAWVARRRESFAAPEDELDAMRWIGFCFDPAMITDRDLWKYDRTVAALDERIAADPPDVRALVYRGNARSFRQDGAADAAADYRAALALGTDLPEARANLERLLAERRP